jgi:hypothetical protein
LTLRSYIEFPVARPDIEVIVRQLRGLTVHRPEVREIDEVERYTRQGLRRTNRNGLGVRRKADDAICTRRDKCIACDPGANQLQLELPLRAQGDPGIQSCDLNEQERARSSLHNDLAG